MTRSLSWLVQRAGVVCGSFEEGATLLGEFTAAAMSESTFRLKVLAAGRRAEADQGMKGRKLVLSPEYTPAHLRCADAPQRVCAWLYAASFPMPFHASSMASFAIYRSTSLVSQRRWAVL